MPDGGQSVPPQPHLRDLEGKLTAGPGRGPLGWCSCPVSSHRPTVTSCRSLSSVNSLSPSGNWVSQTQFALTVFNLGLNIWIIPFRKVIESIPDTFTMPMISVTLSFIKKISEHLLWARFEASASVTNRTDVSPCLL